MTISRSHANEPIVNARQVAEPDMADDSYKRAPRATDFQRQPPAPRSGAAASVNGGDPLAELARLIGNDPFSDFARENAQSAQPPAPSSADPRGHDPRHASHPMQWAEPPVDPRVPPSADPRAVYRMQDEFPDYGSPAPAPGFDPYGRGPGARDDGLPDRDPRQGGYHDRFARRDEGASYGGGYGAVGEGYGHGGQDGYDNAMPPREDADEFYEEDEPRRRRGGMLTVMAVIALAVLGTAGAFGYRVLFSGPSVPATPPVIKASTAPTKVAPAAPAAEANSGKLIYDRVGDRSQAERLVPREEQPLDVKAAPPPPRVVLSNPAAGSAPAAPSAAAFAPAAPAGSIQPPAATPPASTEPKKVRTVVIRPDQPAAAPAAPPPPLSAPVVPQQRAVEPEPVVHAAPPAAPASAPVRPPAPRAQAVPGDPNAPLSLIPQTGAPRGTTMRTAAAGPSRPAVLSSPAGEGAYSVQVTSRRSEPEAQASFRALQAQFPNLLGARQAVIRRADLGEKGVYYRALVGAFANSEEASQLCRDLKAAGGECVVQRN